MAEQGNSVALIRHRRLQSAHFCPQTTQELPKKHDEAGSPEDNDLPTGANCHKSITDTLDTVKGQTL